MEDFPAALVLASQEEVFNDNNVLYRLVRPLADGSGVQSTDRLVNVVPFRRVYTFYYKQEVVAFEQMLLARPLVLQPVLHFGRGIGTCGACYNDEPWILMLNQTHPKILGRFQMGMDLAKQAIARGQSVEMKFCFTSLVQRIYNEHLQQKEKGEAKSFASDFLTRTRFAEWEHADLIIRYHGYEAKSRTKRDRKHHKTFHKEWDFHDIGSHEMKWNQIGQEIFPVPHNAPVSEEELRTNLPSWTINEVSPLEDYGYERPQQNYSYAQAGRLYESFRKKKRQRPPNQVQIPEEDHVEGATASVPSEVNQRSPGIEHDFTYPEDKQSRTLSRARKAYMEQEAVHHGHQDNEASYSHADYHEGERYPPGPSNQLDELDSFHAVSRNHGKYEELPVLSHLKTKADHANERHYNQHVNANVLIQSNPSSQQENTPRQNNSHQPLPNHLNSTLIKRDSDRSHCSTNADSGYDDGHRSRGGSYDYNDHSSRSQHPKSKHTLRDHDSDDGLDNLAFHYDNSERDAIEKHKQFVANMLTEKKGVGNKHSAHQDPQTGVSHAGNQNGEKIAESFI